MTFQQGTVKAVCNRHHAISILFANDPHLLHFFFTDDRQRLRWGDGDVTRRFAEAELDVQEAVLVDLALDAWLEEGQVRLHRTYRHLSPDRFNGLVMAMDLLSAAGGCECQNCRQRLWPNPSNWIAFPQ